MSNRDALHAYLKSLNQYLSRLHRDDAEEVLREIESHVHDALEAGEASGQPVAVDAILAGFGSPRELAGQYVEHVLSGAQPPQGFRAIARIRQQVGRGLRVGMAVFGYGVAGLLLALGVLKLMFPDRVGLWTASHGHSVVIAFADGQWPQASELLGGWLAPLSLLASVAVWLLTHRVLKSLKNHRKNP